MSKKRLTLAEVTRIEQWLNAVGPESDADLMAGDMLSLTVELRRAWQALAQLVSYSHSAARYIEMEAQSAEGVRELDIAIAKARRRLPEDWPKS